MKSELLKNPERVKKIAVLRSNALGDFIFVLPALNALRETFVNAEIVYLGKQWHADFTPNHVPAVDRAVVIPPYPGVGEDEDYKADQQQLETFFSEMQAEKFDIALQMHGGGGNSNPFLLKLGAKLTAGTYTLTSMKPDLGLPYVMFQNEFLRLLEVVSLVGASTAHIVPRVIVTENDRHECAAALKDSKVAQPYIVLHPGASDPRRRWPARNFSKLAQQCIDDGFAVCVTGTPNEAEIVRAVCDGAPGSHSFCGNLSLGGLAALLEGSALVVSNDTGPMHLASAVGAKNVGLYWCVNQLTAAQVTRLHHRPLVSWNLTCPDCGQTALKEYAPNGKLCPHTSSLIADITVEQVLGETQSLLTQA